MGDKNKQVSLTEKRVTGIVLLEMNQYIEAISKSTAYAITMNNAKTLEQLKETGVIK